MADSLAKTLLGLDIGGTKCAVSVGITEADGIRILEREQIATCKTPEDTFDGLSDIINRYIQIYNPVVAGISSGGPLDSQTGVILSPPNLLGWHGFAITDYVATTFGIPAKLENDANACAIAEWLWGAGKGTKNMLFLTFGTGLGAGLILDGKLYGGANGNAGEIGHIRLDKTGPLGYNKYGSFEGFCSGSGIAELCKMLGGHKKYGNNVTAKTLFEEAESGDEFAKEIFASSGEKLGYGLSILIDILNPEKIVIGGVYMRARKHIEPAMMRVLQKETLASSLSVCEIVPSFLGESIGDYAALSVAYR